MAAGPIVRERCKICGAEIAHRDGKPLGPHKFSARHKKAALAGRLYRAHAEALHQQGIRVRFLEWRELSTADRFPWLATADAARSAR